MEAFPFMGCGSQAAGKGIAAAGGFLDGVFEVDEVFGGVHFGGGEAVEFDGFGGGGDLGDG